MHTRKRQRWAYLFIAPFTMSFLVFGIYPIFYSLYISFHEYNPLTLKMTGVGLANYARLIQSDYFFESILNTLQIWIFSIIPQLSIALVLSLILNERFVKGKSTLRSIYYFPNLITPITIGMLFTLLFGYPGGMINLLFKTLGIFPDAVDFANTPILAKLVGGIAICWQNFGYNIIFITAGLHSISTDVYEAAEVDGANALQKTLSITLPLLRPILLYILITSVIGGLQIFDIPKMLFRDGAANATRTMTLYMYEAAFENWQFGFGASAAYGIAVVIGFFSLLAVMITGRKEKEAK
ncbi:MAG: carbohydrate ABC transporter permease [Christensenellales bacterium]